MPQMHCPEKRQRLSENLRRLVSRIREVQIGDEAVGEKANGKSAKREKFLIGLSVCGNFWMDSHQKSPIQAEVHRHKSDLSNKFLRLSFLLAFILLQQCSTPQQNSSSSNEIPKN